MPNRLLLRVHRRVETIMGVVVVILALLSLFGSFVVAYAHEEPNKTLREKEEKHRARLILARAGVQEMVSQRHEVLNGAPTGKKAKAIVQEYDRAGRLLLISAFRNDTLTESATYSYNPSGDMISDIDLDSLGHLSEATFFLYDSLGRMSEGFAYAPTGRLTSRVVNRFDPTYRKITFEKYVMGDSLDYTIEYFYRDSFDLCDYSRAVKLNAQKDTLLVVTKSFDSSGRTTVKNVRQCKPETAYSFTYEYSKGSTVMAVNKLNKDGRIETTTRYTLNPDGTYAAKQDYNAEGMLISLTTFEYIHFVQ